MSLWLCIFVGVGLYCMKEDKTEVEKKKTYVECTVLIKIDVLKELTLDTLRSNY